MFRYSIPIAVLLAGIASAQGTPSASARQLAPLGAKPASTQVVPANHPRFLEVKFADGSGVRLDGERFRGAPQELEAVDVYLDTVGAARRRVFSQSDEWLDAWRRSGEARSGRDLHDLTLFYRIELPANGLVAEVCDALNAFGLVELAYPLPTVSDPVISPIQVTEGATPDFVGMQGYRGPAPTGIDADYGNTFSGGAGFGITIADVETGWTDDHEDIAHKALGNFVGLPNAPYPWDHGTAVVGELVGEHNDLGVRGLCYQADILMSTHQGNSANIPTAIMNGIAAVGPGDVVVLEVQCFGAVPSPHPCEYVASSFAAVEAATANGVHVFAAAGNGSNNLDQAAYGGLFDRNVRDSGAVMVGASDGSSLNIASFSNYGTRCDAHGWGFNVTTAGYGGLHNGGTQETYTSTFSGTSSATPIVTGAGVIIDGIHRAVLGSSLDPLVLRDLLTATGTPQGSGGNIGPRPDVRAAIASLNMPRIDISGNLVPGGDYTVHTEGPLGALYVLVFSPNVRRFPLGYPWGQFFLRPPFSRVKTGVLHTGSADFMQSIPNDGGLSGTTLGYYQVWQRYVGTNGGSFGNYAPVEIQ